MRPLAGLHAPEAAREENFAAWRAFAELLGEDRPSVLVFEDLHWADETLLQFVEYLAGRTPRVSRCCWSPPPGRNYMSGLRAGPHRHATWLGRPPRGPGRYRASDRQPARFGGAARRGAASDPRPVRRQPAVRGTVRAAASRPDILTRAGARWRLEPDAEIPPPPGVQGLIAARLDTLTAQCKRLLQDAAVLGKVFWSGAVADMGGDDEAEVRTVLHELVRKELVRPARRSSMAGQAEYAFAHALIREVCYAQIPRAERAQRHLRGPWIEAMAGERAADHAEILAAHYTAALDLARAAGHPPPERLPPGRSAT